MASHTDDMRSSYLTEAEAATAPELLDAQSKAQLVLILLDLSGSMAESGTSGMARFREAIEAIVGYFQAMHHSSMRKSFQACIITFSGISVEVALRPFSLDDVVLANRGADAIAAVLPEPRGGTPIGSGLLKAREVAQTYLDGADEVSREALIYLLSDGLCNEGPAPEAIASQMRKDYGGRVRIYTAAYGVDADHELMKRLASGPECYLDTNDPAKWRDFMIRSSVVAAAGFRLPQSVA